jgi:hypothetical protein
MHFAAEPVAFFGYQIGSIRAARYEGWEKVEK